MLKQCPTSLFYSRFVSYLLVAICFVIACSVASESASADSLNKSSPKLEGGGPVVPIIRSVSVEIVDIFDGPNLSWFHRVANRLKFPTEQAIIRRELLFEEGDPYDEFLVAESERNLRSLRFLNNVAIIAIMGDDYVDIVVTVQDTWTIFPQVFFSSGGGTNKQSLGLAEKNLFGYGKRLEFLYGEDENRKSWECLWKDPRVFGTKQELTIFHFDRSDGTKTYAAISHPFRNFVDPAAWKVEADYFDVVGKLFRDGEESMIYRQLHRMFKGSLSLAFGKPEHLQNRVSFGYDYNYDHFRPPSSEDYDETGVDPRNAQFDQDLLAKDRRYSGPSIGWQRVEPDFISLNYIDSFGRVEDFNLGNDLQIKNVFAPRLLDSEEDALLLSVSDSEGKRFGGRSFGRMQVSGASRIDPYGFSNTNLSLSMRYYNVIGYLDVLGVSLGKHTLASAFRVDWGDHLDNDTQYLLGAFNGLRGYSDRAFTGTSRVVYNAEDRVHFVEDLFRLLDLGGAVFFDVGGTGERSFGDIFAEELRADLGFGLRFGFPKASGGGILRLDLAFPLRNAADGSAAFEPRLLITTGQVFSSRFAGESDQPGINLAFSP